MLRIRAAVIPTADGGSNVNADDDCDEDDSAVAVAADTASTPVVAVLVNSSRSSPNQNKTTQLSQLSFSTS